jgi:hypothetical protein
LWRENILFGRGTIKFYQDNILKSSIIDSSYIAILFRNGIIGLIIFGLINIRIFLKGNYIVKSLVIYFLIVCIPFAVIDDYTAMPIFIFFLAYSYKFLPTERKFEC